MSNIRVKATLEQEPVLQEAQKATVAAVKTTTLSERISRFSNARGMYRRKMESGGEHQTANAGTAGRDAPSSSLDFSDSRRGSRGGSSKGELSSYLHGSRSAGVGSFFVCVWFYYPPRVGRALVVSKTSYDGFLNLYVGDSTNSYGTVHTRPDGRRGAVHTVIEGPERVAVSAMSLSKRRYSCGLLWYIRSS